MGYNPTEEDWDYPKAAGHDIEARPDHETTSEPGILNPVRLALEWQAMLARDNALTKATIARNMGLSWDWSGPGRAVAGNVLQY